MDLPELYPGRNPKIHCPFGEMYHHDGGAEPAMRVYPDSNHLYCFAGCGAFGPVALVAHAFGLTRRAAARELLDRAGIRAPSWRKTWDQALAHREPLDTASLAQALQIFCRRLAPDWRVRQLDPPYSTVLARCIGLLEHVKDEQAAREWLDGCKTVMGRLLTNQTTNSGAGSS